MASLQETRRFLRRGPSLNPVSEKGNEFAQGSGSETGSLAP